MATMVSVVSGANIVYTITDEQSNTCTVTAPPPGQKVAISTAGLLNDGLADLQRLLTQMLGNGAGPRPQVIPGTTDSWFS